MFTVQPPVITYIFNLLHMSNRLRCIGFLLGQQGGVVVDNDVLQQGWFGQMPSHSPESIGDCELPVQYSRCECRETLPTG